MAALRVSSRTTGGDAANSAGGVRGGPTSEGVGETGWAELASTRAVGIGLAEDANGRGAKEIRPESRGEADAGWAAEAEEEDSGIHKLGIEGISSHEIVSGSGTGRPSIPGETLPAQPPTG